MSTTNLSLAQNPNGWRTAALLTTAALLVILGLFWQTALSMVDIWWRSETFAHGFLIAPISLWLIWRKRKELAALTPQPNPLGFIFMAGFSLLWLISHLVDILVIQQFALVGAIIAAVWTLLGTAVAWAIAFPLGFLFFAVPVGEGLIPPMMDFTADFTVKALQLTGIPVYREGTFFEIPSGNWSVVEGCSGVRYLIASATLGFLYAYLTYRSMWRRTIFITLSVIIPIFANGMRAYMIVMIAHLSDMKLALGIDHYIYGWVFFGLVMILLFWIGSFWREDEYPVPVRAAPLGGIARSAGNGINRKMTIMGAGVLAALGIGPLAAHLYQGDTNEAAQVTLHAPAPAGNWQASTAPTWDWQPRYLGMTAQLQKAYMRGDQAASIYLAYYRNQRQDAELVNSQNVMIEQKHPVWSNIGEQFITIPLNGHSVQIRQTRLRSPGMNLLIWDWYWLDGTYTSNHYVAKLIEAKNKLLGGQRNAAGIVIATTYEEKLEPAVAVLRDVVTDMLPSIEASLNDASGQ
ncbi:MAG: exosortase A [Gammaproteobacteria bacterium]|nr:exosortase A [Gammaproteobacteria bacterium]